jgi:hypothetical protein
MLDLRKFEVPLIARRCPQASLLSRLDQAATMRSLKTCYPRFGIASGQCVRVPLKAMEFKRTRVAIRRCHPYHLPDPEV